MWMRQVLKFLEALQEDSWLLPDIQHTSDWFEGLFKIWIQGTFLEFSEEEIFTFGAWVYAIMGLMVPNLVTLFDHNSSLLPPHHHPLPAGSSQKIRHLLSHTKSKREEC